MTMMIGIEPKNFQIRPMQEIDIGVVVELHRAALDYSINSRLGSRHLASLYKIMHTDSFSMVAVAHLGKKPIGMASATLDPERLKKLFLSNLLVKQWVRLFVQLIIQPHLLLDLIENVQTDRPVYWNGNQVTHYLSAIAVNEEYRRRGVGRALLGAIESFFICHGSHAYRLNARADNLYSRSFCQRLGFLEIEQRGRDVILVKTTQ